MAERAFIALGSNLGSRAAYLTSARAAISLLPTTHLIAASRVEETVPFGPGAQGPYLNQMLSVDTLLPPALLLSALHRIEQVLGRVRAARWGARTIDLDIVSYGALSQRSATLSLPHPGLGSRLFWQRELAELRTLAKRPA